MHRLGLCLFTLTFSLSGCAIFQCQPPSDGPIATGLWAGSQWNFTFQPDGSAYIEGSCASGAVLEKIITEDGFFSFTVRMTSQATSPATQSYEVYFEGEICGDTMQGFAHANGSRGAFSATLGDPSRLNRCQTTSVPLPQ